MKNIKKSKLMAYLGLFLAIDVILTRFFALQQPGLSWRISFGYIPASMCAAIFGPYWGALEAIAADLIGATLFPTGALFPGYTVSAGLRGLIYGLFLYKSTEINYKLVIKSVLAAFIIAVVIDLILNSAWDVIYFNIPYYINIYKKLLPVSVNLFLRCITIPLYMLWINKYIRKTIIL